MLVPLTSAAALALTIIQPANPSPTPADVSGLIDKMKASYDGNSWSAVYTLGHVGRPAVPALIAVLRDRSLPSLSNVRQPARYQAAFALAKIGPAAAEAVPELLRIVRDRTEDEGVRWAAASALGSIGHDPDEVVPALVAVLEEAPTSGSSLSWYGVGALAQLASQQPAALPALRRARPALERAHARMGGSGGFATIFRVLEPPSKRRLRDEEDIREAVRRHELKDASPLAARSRRVDVDAIDWLSNDRVHTSTTACFGVDPCSLTVYELVRRRGRWTIVSETHPLVV